ncbi:MAG: DUF3787 domain-containing protein [Ruminiclostridium sp.]|nr:DUF3787 domain-containing protein [Ruminiclostridium sp.]
MAQNRYKEKHMAIPVEKHDTAAWANIRKTKRVSNVTIPSELQVNNSKEHVDSNEKKFTAKSTQLKQPTNSTAGNPL